MSDLTIERVPEMGAEEIREAADALGMVQLNAKTTKALQTLGILAGQNGVMRTGHGSLLVAQQVLVAELIRLQNMKRADEDVEQAIGVIRALGYTADKLARVVREDAQLDTSMVHAAVAAQSASKPVKSFPPGVQVTVESMEVKNPE